MKLLLTVAASITIAYAQATAPAGKMAEEAYKNIVELKGVPADKVGPAMQFIASSLGVECTFCHVQGKMEADDKGAKKTAREMMHMQAEINKASFRGQKQVTCYSCHRGSARPVTGAACAGGLPARTSAWIWFRSRSASACFLSALSAAAFEQRARGEQAQERDHQRLRDVSARKRIANDVIEICHRLLLRYLTQRPRTRGQMLRRPTNI